jgi:membrane protein YdbS with pleckstrin-like domain
MAKKKASKKKTATRKKTTSKKQVSKKSAPALIEFEVDRKKAASYFYWATLLILLLIALGSLGFGLPFAAIYAFAFGPWLAPKQAAALRYRIEGNTLRIDQGVFFLKRKAIPLDRITDAVLSQGPLLRACGIWTLNIQTAGTGQQIAEGVLYGLPEHEKVREIIIEARDEMLA